MSYEDKLIQKIQQGDSTCLEELVGMYYDEIMRYCIWHTSDRETAEDATQETFMKMLKHINTYSSRGKFKAYLYKVATNTCRDIWKKKANTNERESKCIESEAFTELGFEQIEGEIQFRAALKDLPSKQREIVILRYSNDLTLLQISKILDIPFRTAQTRLKAAIRKLKKNMERGDIK